MSKLKQLRIKNNLTIDDVVVALYNIGHRRAGSSVVRWEKTGQIKLDDARALAQVYNVKVDDLF